ncbi:MAG: glycosyltransferase family 2 protein [Candidatus Electrothrix aestuarii]|uniref:Glycosyltransferase family 2 protein n=1 Tax=Candidatus Electrothrix aestuarii TaxID=3062594 RepID=A0AAU8LS85_9BACT|nr:glycosyltransferase family 2 protein [Candidatus Electrothrix aestuarii]
MSEIISVIITCHNLERYIGEAIESVLAQDYDGPIELLVVDDASIDTSAEIIHSYQKNILYLPTLKNVGVLMATVHGLRHSSGDVVFFLDGDDTWRTDKLRLSMQPFNVDPKLGFLTHDINYMDSCGAIMKKKSRSSEVFGKKNIDGELVRKGILHHTDYIWLGSAYAVRQSVADIKGFCRWTEHLPNPFNTYQDWPLAYWAASHSDITMRYLPEKMMNYRLHEENYSGDARSLQKALRNFGRTYNTVSVLLDIAVLHGVTGVPFDISVRKKKFYQYMLDLYSGKRLSALLKFFFVQRYIFTSTPNIFKEWIRFVGIFFLGPRYFLKITKPRT